MLRKQVICSALVFLAFVACWYLFDQGYRLALVAIALPVYILLTATGEIKFVLLSLAVYAGGLVVGVSWLKTFPKAPRVILAVGVALLLGHLLCFQLIVRAFEQLGAEAVELILERR